jgi:hypothetical protein
MLNRITISTWGLIACLALVVVWFHRSSLWRWWTAFWDSASWLLPNVSRQKLVAMLSILGSTVAVFATFFWLRSPKDVTAEPKSQFLIAIAWLVVAVIQFLIPSDPEWEMIHAKRAKFDAETLQRVLDRIQIERRNFEQLRSRNGRYSNDAHRKAVEVDSFDLLLTEITPISSNRKYKANATLIIKEI